MTLSISELDSLLRKQLESYEVRSNESIRRTLRGPISRNFELKTNVGKFRGLRERKTLALVSWYLGDLGYLIREDLRERIEKQPLQERMEVSLYLDYKMAALETTLSSQSDGDFFGNLLPLILQLASRVTCRLMGPKPAKATVRRRGYQDHGSCKPKDKWLPTFDAELNELQEKIEKERKTYQDTQQFLLGLLGVF